MNKTSKNTFYSSLPSSSGPSSSVIGVIDVLKNINNDILPCVGSSTGNSTGNNSTTGTPKIENKFRNSKIQKQISLYEKDLSTEYKNLSFDGGKFSDSQSNIKVIKRRYGTVDQPPLSTNFISAGDLEKSINDIERNLSNVNLENKKEKCIKTKSCVNLKSCTTASSSSASAAALPSISINPLPGAVVIKESFIEPPKRIANSFHGKTQYSNLDKIRRSNSSVAQPNLLMDINEPPSATTTTLSSSTFESRKLTNIQSLQRQYSTPNSVCPPPPPPLLNPSNQTRFKTTLVRENYYYPSQSVDDEALDSACSLEEEKLKNIRKDFNEEK